MEVYRQDKKRLFFVNPKWFPKWPYESRLATAVKLEDFRGMGADVWEFTFSEEPKFPGTYRITKARGVELAERYTNHHTVTKLKVPNLIPIEEFEWLGD